MGSERAAKLDRFIALLDDCEKKSSSTKNTSTQREYTRMCLHVCSERAAKLKRFIALLDDHTEIQLLLGVGVALVTPQRRQALEEPRVDGPFEKQQHKEQNTKRTYMNVS